jgi:rubrerythrin
MMIEQAQIADQFQTLLGMFQQAHELYADLAASEADPQLKAQLEHLCREKQRHVALTERLLEIVE